MSQPTRVTELLTELVEEANGLRGDGDLDLTRLADTIDDSLYKQTILLMASGRMMECSFDEAVEEARERVNRWWRALA